GGTRARPRSPSSRRIRLAVAAIAAVVTLGAGAQVPSGPLTPAGRIPFAGSAHLLVVAGDAVVLDNNGSDRISAYALPSGRRIWTEPAAGTAFNADLVATPHTVIATLPQRRGYQSQIEGIDLRTGSIRWQRIGSLAQLVPGGLLIATGSGSANFESLVDPDSGATVWSVPLPSDCGGMPSGGVLLEFCPASGRIDVRDLRSGRITASRNLAAPPVEGSTGAQVQSVRLLYTGRITLLGFAHGTRMNVAALRTADLSTLWSGLSRHGADQPVACGADLCLGGAGDNEIVVDPISGARLNSAPRPLPSTLSPGALLLVRTDVDYATIRSGAVPVGGEPVPAGTDVQIVDAGHGSVWIVTPTSTSLRLLQRLSGVETAACVSIAGYVACARTAGELTFWRRIRP
ncbi:MAG TPA: PQQ-binding-like beta-propeller repeat protein, partial [Micromonosporaceae bacterium]